jgi:hypothetical protein
VNKEKSSGRRKIRKEYEKIKKEVEEKEKKSR